MQKIFKVDCLSRHINSLLCESKESNHPLRLHGTCYFQEARNVSSGHVVAAARDLADLEELFFVYGK
ncbi:MAG: hypothetical protein ACK5DD_09435 [Cyclobacteriaceae bacterium]|jgi:hypothetical protein